MVSDAPCRVVTSATLFRIITSYQGGVPSAFFHFWCARAAITKAPTVQQRSKFAKGLEQVPEYAARHGDWRLLKLLPFITLSIPPRQWSGVCRQAARKNDAVMLKWAIDQGYLHVTDTMIVRDLVRRYEPGDLRALSVVEDQRALLQSISPKLLTSSDLYHELKDAALIQWLHTHVPQLEWQWKTVVEYAVINGQLQILQYAYACASSTEWDIAALMRRSLPTPEFWSCIRYLLHNHSSAMTGGDLAYILLTAPVELVEIVSGVESLWKSANEATVMAVRQQNMGALRRFAAAGLGTSDKPIDIAQSTLYDAMLYLFERRLVTVTDTAMDRAARDGAWAIVRCLHDQYSVQCTTDAMDEAAKQGRLDEVVFLHEHRTEGCSAKALYHAASNDNLPLVRYLTEVVHAPATTKAMDNAAASGHLDVVKYIHTNRSEGCTSDAVRNALENGHEAVVQYLFTHSRHVFDGTLLESLLVHGEFVIWETLRDTYPEEAELSIVAAMKAAGKNYNLPAIRFIVHTLGRSDLAHIPMQEAACEYNLTWAAAMWRVAGPQSCTFAAIVHVITYGKKEGVQFLIDNCVEPSAKERAIQYAREKNQHKIAELLQQEWTPTPADSVELHPWLVDARTPQWVVQRLCGGGGWASTIDVWYGRVTSFTWPIQATYRRDHTVLAMALEASGSTTAAGGGGDTGADPELSFDGARAAAVRIDNLPTLQWLLEHAKTPVEPTLLDEALFYHRYEVARWLASHCPQACTAFEPRHHGYDLSLRQWLESDEGETVRAILDMDALPWDSIKHSS